MIKKIKLLCIIVIVFGANCGVWAQASSNFKGRIAYCVDGNINSKSDWAASPIALAIFAEAGLKDKLVHFAYNCNLNQSNEVSEENHKKGVLEAARLYNYNLSNFYDCQLQFDTAAQRIADAVNVSSENNPLYIVLAGSLELPFLGISKSDPEKWRYVYCISQNNWRDVAERSELLEINRRDLISSGVTWIPIARQNQWLNTSSMQTHGGTAKANWKPWFWMRDSGDEKVKFLWEMLQLTTQPEAPNVGLAYFLASGDEEATLPKLKKLLDENERLAVVGNQKKIRIEAENFYELKGAKVNFSQHELCSHGASVKHSARLSWEINTLFNAPNVKERNKFDISIRYYSGKYDDAEYTFLINDRQQDTIWLAGESEKWQTKTIKNVLLRLGDKISIQITTNRGSGIQIDYIDLFNTEENNPFLTTPTWPLPSPIALPGQLVVLDKGKNYPGYLAYNGVGPAFLCGAALPEDFLWYGYDFNDDGTLKDSLQQEMIHKLADNHVNIIRFQMFRMQSCNLKNEGDNRHNLFVDNDPAKGPNLDVLFQWEQWITRLEKAGVAVYLEFYGDNTDVQKIGWGMQADGELHPDEARFIKSVVHRFKHHRNIIWGIQEAANILDRERVAYFKKVAQLISDTDKYKHPIVQSFIVRNNKEGDYNSNSGSPDDYLQNSNVDIINWLNVNSYKHAHEEQYQEYLDLLNTDNKSFVVMKGSVSIQGNDRKVDRINNWACAMSGMHCLGTNSDVFEAPAENLFEAGLVSTFMEQTDFQNMNTRNDLKHTDTNWVLANPGQSYVVYSYQCENYLGLKQMTDGVYEILWMDTKTGATTTQYNVPVEWGINQFEKPAGFGKEVVAYILKK